MYVSDANGKNFNVDIEDVDSVVDVKKDSFYQIRISYKDNTTNGDVVLMAPAEVLEEAATAAGTAVRLVFHIGPPPQASPQENLQNLLKFGSQFDNIEIK